MFQAIQTRYWGPTNTKGAKIRARADAGRLDVPYDHALDAQQNHRAAAEAFAKARGWQGKLIGGALHDGSYAFVFAAEA
jgi:hypothetical protein